MATVPAGGTPYGDITQSIQTRREKAGRLDTSDGDLALTVSLNATFNEAAEAQATLLKAQRVVTKDSTGKATLVTSAVVIEG